MFWKSRKQPVRATNRAKAALGWDPALLALNEAAVEAALAPETQAPEIPVTTLAKPAPTPIPSSPAGHLAFAERMTAQMDADEAQLIADIEEEKAAHDRTIEGMEARLAETRKTRAFYATAPGFLAEAIEPQKPSRRRVRGSTAVEADAKPQDQEATNA